MVAESRLVMEHASQLNIMNIQTEYRPMKRERFALEFPGNTTSWPLLPSPTDAKPSLEPRQIARRGKVSSCFVGTFPPFVPTMFRKLKGY